MGVSNGQPAASTAVALGMDLTQFDAGTASARAKLTAMTQHFERSLSSAGKSSEVFGERTVTALDLATQRWSGFGAVLKGAQPAIAGMSQVAVALGEKAAPAVNQLAGSLSSLLSGGFTPLGLAIGAVTTAIGYFTAAQSDSTTQTEKHTKKISEQEEALTRLRDRQREVWMRELAPESADIAGLLLKREQLAQDLAILEYARPTGKTGTREETIRVVAMQRQRERLLAAKQAEIDAVDTEIAQYRALEFKAKSLEDAAKDAKDSADRARKAQEDDLRAREDWLRRGVSAIRARQLEDWQSAVDPYEDLMPDERGVAREEAAREERMRRAMDAVRRRQIEFDEPAPAIPRDVMFSGDPWADTMPDERGVAREEAARAERLRKLSEEATALAEAQRRAQMDFRVELSQTEQTLNDVGEAAQEGIGDTFTDAFMQAQSGAESFGRAFSRLALDVVEDIERMILKQLIFNQLANIVVSALPGVGVAPARPGGPLPQTPIVNNADGGSYRVRGVGGIDSAYVGMRATPGELIEVTPQGKSPARSADAGVSVTVINTTGQPSRQQRRRGADGREEIQILVGEAVAADLAAGGPAARALERHYGARRDPVRRG